MVFATIITDASWSHKNLSGSWAGSVISCHGRDTFSGELKGVVPSSNFAEIAAVANTLHAALHTGEALRSTMGWLIQTDNAHIVHLLNFHFESPLHKRKPRFPPKTIQLEENCVAWVERLRGLAKPKFILARHVKGHIDQASRKARHHVQENMDKLAATHRRRS